MYGAFPLASMPYGAIIDTSGVGITTVHISTRSIILNNSSKTVLSMSHPSRSPMLTKDSRTATLSTKLRAVLPSRPNRSVL